MGLPTAKLRDVPSCPARVVVGATVLSCQRVNDGHDVHGGTTTGRDDAGAPVPVTYQWGLA